MSLSSGSRLGEYEVLESIGAGGMGEVYRARDTRLGREVALKILPQELAGDPERLARFSREAKLLASLNHANIATLHAFEHSSLAPIAATGEAQAPIHYLVMELVEGPTLSERLASQGMPLDECLRLFLQIAEGLDCAHQQGIIHRDLKPANIKIRPDDATPFGRIKLLDFGLAKALLDEVDGEVDSPSLQESPTLTLAATQRGEILGTAGYMSPEQARGGDVDRRTDVWAFGCCLYEALTGKRSFQGDTAADTLANVLKSDPEWDQLPADLPPRLRRLLQHCLQKKRGQRLRDIGDAAFELRSLVEGGTVEEASLSAAPPRKPRWLVTAIVGAAAAVGGMLVGLALRPTPGTPGERPVRRYAESIVELDSAIHSIAMSRDGRLVAVSSPVGSRKYAQASSYGPLMLRRIGATGLHPIPGSEMAEFPFFSPDGEWLAYFTRAGNHLEKVPVGGGPVTRLADSLGRNWGGSWGDDGWLVYHSILGGEGLSRLSELGGPSRVMTQPDPNRGEWSHRWPQVLSGSRQIVFTIWKGSADASEVALLTLPEGTIRTLVAGTSGRYVDSGHLVFFDGNFMMVAPLDLEEGRITADPVRMPGIESGGVWGHRSVALSQNGLLVEAVRPVSRLLWVDRAGRETPIPVPEGSYRCPALSPSGNRFAVSMSQGGRSDDIWIFDVDGSGPMRLTDHGENRFPVWIDEDWIAFQSERDGARTTYRQRVGGGDAEALIQGDYGHPIDVTADGGSLSINHFNDIWLLSLEGLTLLPLVQTQFVEGNANFSNDGLWYAYGSSEFDLTLSHVAPLDGSSGRLNVNASNDLILWSPDSDEIFMVRNSDVRMMSVRSFEDGRVGPYRDLFLWQYVLEGNRDWDTDGERFLVVRDDVPTIRYVENWFEEVRSLLPQ